MSAIDESVVTISRPSVLGNPFPLQDEAQREYVIQRYKQWLEVHKTHQTNVWKEVLRLAERSHSGEKLALECWCAPLPCHGDVLVQVIESINS